MSASRRPWVILAVALVATAVAVGGWWFVDGSDPGRPSRAQGGRDTDEPPGAASRVGAAYERSVDGLAARRPQLVAGLLVAPELGPLTLGRVDLWCEDGELAASVGVDEDGGFSGPACDHTTCARLLHPAFEQLGPWELEPDQRREFALADAPGITGVVVSTAGEPVPGASMILRDARGQRVATQTDEAGEFSVRIPGLRPCDACDRSRGAPNCQEPGRGSPHDHGRVFVSSPEFAPIEVEVALGAPAPLELVLPEPAAPITGVVLGREGRAFEDRTKVLATNIEREAEQHSAEVDASGHFELGGLAEGRYRLRALRDGRELASVEAVEPGEQVELRAEISARGHLLRLTVLDARTDPVAEVRVDGGPFRGATTDHEGQVSATGVLSGSYTLRLRAGDCPVVREHVELREAAHVTSRLPAGCDPHP